MQRLSIIITLIIFIFMIIFFFPVKLNNLCKIGAACPPSNTFVSVTEISTNPRFAGINYLSILVELILSYLLSILMLKIYSKLNLSNRKIVKVKHE